MAAKKSTILLLPEGTEKVKRLRFFRTIVVIAVLLFLASAVYVWSILDDYRQMKSRLPRLTQVQKEEEQREKQLAHLSRKVEEVTRKMGELEEYNRRLKGMVELNGEEEGRRTRVAGVPGSGAEKRGGETEEDPGPFMNGTLEGMGEETADEAIEVSELKKFFENQAVQFASAPFRWPLRGWLSSGFGYRVSPFTGEKEFHRGIDVVARNNAPVSAPADGIVSSIVADPGFGRILTVRHGYGIITKYAHIERPLVKRGQYVRRGEHIALVGNTGHSIGPHLHYEFYLNGIPVDPLRYTVH